jgi:predicted O-linked N-acetylglucosamine transferase (SPINDLY family)
MFNWIDKLSLWPKGPKRGPGATALSPDTTVGEAQACKDRGNEHLARGELEPALACYRQAIAIAPNYAEAHNNLGAVLSKQASLDEAIGCFERAIALKPGLAQPHVNLGLAYKSQDRTDEALACFNTALSIDPELAEVHNNLGILLQERGQLDDALAHFRKAVALKPDLAQAHNNIGIVAADRGRLHEAYAHYRKAMALQPDYAEAWSNYLLTMQYDPAFSPAGICAEHLRFGERFETPLRPTWPKHGNSRDPNRRLRVGFVSGDLRTHPVGHFMEGVLAHLDTRVLAITLYPTNLKEDELSRRLRHLDVSWQPVAGLSDDDAAQRVRNDGIDILVDLSGHTEDNRLLVFARKPAPVQVSWLYFSTTGLTAMDYLLCDRFVVPSGEVIHYVEKLWVMPNSYLCFTPPRDDVQVGELPASRHGHTTFGCFNNLTKMDDAVVRCWARLLKTLPDSRLFLKSRQLNDHSMQLTTLERFGQHGIGPDRLILEGPSPRSQYLAAYNRIDIALDPFPFPGGTTTVEALWMGVPVLTRRGDRFIAHAGESILANADLSDWIADDDDDYIAKACAFAADRQYLTTLRAGLRPRLIASPLCDAPKFALNLAAAFREMWAIYCASR